MTDLELLSGLEPEIPGWTLQNRLREAGYVNIWQTRYTPANYTLWQAFIFDDLRIDEETASSLDFSRMDELARFFTSPRINRHVIWFFRYFGRTA
jgi:hypothetical protein